MSSRVSTSVAYGVAQILLDDPKNANAMSLEMVADLQAALDQTEADDTVRVIVLAGAGRGFSSGADLRRYAPKNRDANADRDNLMTHHIGLCDRLWDYPKPTIGKIHGYSFGMASLYLTCVDLVYVASDASIGWPLPLGGGMVGPQWSYLVGARKAKEFSLIPATVLTGGEAAAAGWANAAVDAAQLDAHVDGIARRVAKVPGPLLKLKKDAINAVLDRAGFRATLRDAASWNAIGHTIPAVHEVGDLMRTHGLKELQRFYREPSSTLGRADD